MTCAGVRNCLAATLTNPLDVGKIRMQMHGEGLSARSESTLGMARFILAKEAVRGMWAVCETNFHGEMSTTSC